VQQVLDRVRRTLTPPVLLALVAVLVVAVVVFGLGRLTGSQAQLAASAATATAGSAATSTAGASATSTPLIPTPTPSLALHSPRVLASYTVATDELTNPFSCSKCDSVTFTSTGPFYLLVACASSVDSRVEYRLLNAGGHILDDLEHTCTGSNATPEATTTFSVPENQPAGSYTVRFIWQDSVVALTLLERVL
jgi:hypothetical protein